MHTGAHTYIHMHVPRHIHTHVRAHIHIHAQTHKHTRARTYTHTHIHTLTCTHAYARKGCAHDGLRQIFSVAFTLVLSKIWGQRLVVGTCLVDSASLLLNSLKVRAAVVWKWCPQALGYEQKCSELFGVQVGRILRTLCRNLWSITLSLPHAWGGWSSRETTRVTFLAEARPDNGMSLPRPCQTLHWIPGIPIFQTDTQAQAFIATTTIPPRQNSTWPFSPVSPPPHTQGGTCTMRGGRGAPWVEGEPHTRWCSFLPSPSRCRHPQDNRRPRSEGVEERESRGKGREVEARDAVAVKKATHTGQDRRKGAPMSSPAQMRGLLHAARYKLWLLWGLGAIAGFLWSTEYRFITSLSS